MDFKEIWSIPETRIRQYFEKTYQVSFRDGACLIDEVRVEIRILPPNAIMKVPIPRCSVEIAGPDEAAEEVHRKFMMNFLSAGG